MLQNLSGWHALLILAVVLLVFGSTKLPALAKSVGESMRILKEEVNDSSAASAAAITSAATTADDEVIAPTTAAPIR